MAKADEKPYGQSNTWSRKQKEKKTNLSEPNLTRDVEILKAMSRAQE